MNWLTLCKPLASPIQTIPQWHYGIRGKLLLWLKSFLTNRRQRVVQPQHNKIMSAWSHVVSGVPQGTISGPVLFLIFVNDIPEYCNTNVKLFADDTKLFNNNTDRTECQDLQYDLNALSAWSKTGHMNFNASKCAVLRIKPKTSFTYSLNNTPLKEENEQKDLGIIVSNDLKPRKHVLRVCTQTNRISGIVKRCFTQLDKNKISTLYWELRRSI